MFRRPLALLPLFAAVPALLSAQEPKAPAGNLVATQKGNFPVILSAPHGGTAKVPGAEPRKGEGMEKGGKGFVVARDTGTEELAYALAAEIEKKLGKKPYYVVAKFARTYVDANRPPEIGVEDPKARPVYDAYRGALATYCKEVKKEHGRGLLLDLHGQGTAKDTIFRGTQNGSTVSLLRQRYGEKARIGPKSFFGLLAANGCKVFPETDSTEKERAGFTGGDIVRTYGGEGHGIDAMQLEFGGDYRNKEHREDTAKKVTAAIGEYLKLYLSGD